MPDLLRPFMFDETPALVADLVRSMDNGELANITALIDFSGWLIRLGLPEAERQSAIARAHPEIRRAVYAPDLSLILVYLRGDSLDMTATEDLSVAQSLMESEPNLFVSAPLITREWLRGYGRSVFAILAQEAQGNA